EPRTPEESARRLHEAAASLFDGLVALPANEKERARKTAAFMNKAGLRWGPSVLAVLGEPERLAGPLAGLDSWRRLAEWEEQAPPALPLPAEFRGCRQTPRYVFRPARGHAGPDCALGRGERGRRSFRRGFSRFPCRFRSASRADRPARRMHLCRLSPLPDLLH